MNCCVPVVAECCIQKQHEVCTVKKEERSSLKFAWLNPVMVMSASSAHH
jgi:hypothetical protein